MKKNTSKLSQKHPKNQLFLALSIITMCLFLVNLTSAATTVFANYSTADGAGTEAYTTRWVGQTFQSVETGDAVSVYLELSRTGTAGNFQITLYGTDASDKPDIGSGILAYAVIDGSTIGTSRETIKMNFTSAYGLTAGTNYSLVANMTGGDGGNYIFWHGDDNEGVGTLAYPLGHRSYSTDSGSSWTNNYAVDYFFNVTSAVSADSSIIINLTSPENGTSLAVTGLNFTANYTTANVNLTNATYTIWYVNNTLFNQTTISATTNATMLTNKTDLFIDSITLSSYKWNIYACGLNDTGQFCSWADNNFTFEGGASEDAYYYLTNVTETQSATFRINISLIEGVNLFAARLNYNGTSYLATKTSIGSDEYELSRTIDIPLLTTPYASQNKTFYWEFEYRNGFEGRQNSTTYSHLVNPLILVECNDTYKYIHLANYTTYNETSLAITNTTMNAAFTFWLGSGTITKNSTLNTTSPTTKGSYSICSNNETNNKVVNVSAIINIKDTLYGGLQERTFYFNKERYSNTTSNVNLYLVDSDLSKSIIVETTNPGLVPSVGYYVKIYRYYPGLNDYLIVERAKTDEFGQIVARLIEPNTVKYQFEFLDSSNNILKRTADMTIACRATYCVIPFVIEDTTDDFARFDNVTGYDYTLSFSNTTNRFTFTWNDATGDSITSRLFVERILFNGTTTVCNTTSTSISGTLTCDVGNSTASYRAQIFRQASGEDEVRVNVLSVKVGDISGIFGLEGLIWAFILLFTLVAVGSFNPSVGVGLYLVGFIALGVLNIISFNPIIFFANLVLGIIFIWAVRT